VANQKSSEKTVFISRMSHELRTPLHGLLSSASLLEQTPLTEEQSTFLSLINSCGELLLDTVVKILDISKIESGKFETELQEFCLFDIVQNVVDSVAGLAGAKSLELLMNFNLSEGTYRVEGDQRHFREILTNVSPTFSVLLC